MFDTGIPLIDAVGSEEKKGPWWFHASKIQLEEKKGVKSGDWRKKS